MMKEYIIGIENEHPHALDVCYKKELIRCKDCKYYVIQYCEGFGDGYYVPEFGYCHNAERKEE